MTELWQISGFGVYLHWPFCQSKCPYCDFNSHVADVIDQNRWADAYVAEIGRVGDLTPGRTVSTVYFGGGTPSLMDAETIDRILCKIRETWPVSNDPEITLEANPSSVESGRFQAYRDAGVNRVSLGVQALNDGDLRRLGRLHSAAEARVALDIARSVFDRVSFDLIYARQDQSIAAWHEELQRALSWEPDHLSLYQLTIEDGTVFGDRFARGLLRGLPSEDSGADMFDLTQQVCGDAGLPAYEVSNHARAGSESRHNLIYWRGGDYAGIGPGAHGRLTLNGDRFATETFRAPTEWLRAVEARQSGQSGSVRLSKQDQASECLLMGMRLKEGVPLDRLPWLEKAIDFIKIKELKDSGLVDFQAGTLAVTDRGRIVLNAVLRELLVDTE